MRTAGAATVFCTAEVPAAKTFKVITFEIVEFFVIAYMQQFYWQLVYFVQLAVVRFD